MKYPELIYGVDFSGAKDAGRKIWLSQGVVNNGKILIKDSFRGADLPNSGRKREQCLMALIDFIEKERDCAFGFDFPFGLPETICKGLDFDTWEKFIRDFPEKFDNPDNFKEQCWAFAGNSELKRTTDIESQTPFSPYNLRIYKTTYYGITGLLYPLVMHNKVCVPPMQEPQKGKSLVLEICPASTLKKESLYLRYKGKSLEQKSNRGNILKYLESKGVSWDSGSLKKRIIDDPEGDAIDCVIAAYATFRALANPLFPFPDGINKSYKLEGYVYT